MANEIPLYLETRPEARPLGVEGWSESQKEAGLRILRIINGCLQNANAGGPGREDGPEHALDPMRSSRVIFLDGDRGMGKTTLLLSIMKLLGDASSRDGEDDVRREAGALAGKVRWLEILDLEPLPQPTNLFASLLARLENLSKSPCRADRVGPQTSRTRVPIFAEDETLFTMFRELKTDVSLAWDGNLPSRAGQLDPDAYATEVERAEQARLSLNRRFSKLLESLAEHLSPREACRPIFILPVDDFDLNPTRAVELMHLLRFLTTPRLLVLIMGDEHLLERVLVWKKEGELRALVGGGEPDQSLRETAKRVAATTMRKLIPPAQRVHLSLPKVEHALAFPAAFLRASDGSGRRAADDPSLEAVIRAISLDFPRRKPCSLYDFLRPTRGPDASSVEYSYVGARALCLPPRSLFDLYMELRGRRFERTSDVVDFMGHHALRSIAEDDEILGGEGAVLSNLLRPASGGWMAGAQGVAFALETTPGMRFPMPMKLAQARVGAGTIGGTDVIGAPAWEGELRTETFSGWKLVRLSASPSPPIDRMEREEYRTIAAGDRTMAALALVHDLVALGGTERHQSLLRQVDRLSPPCVWWSLAGSDPIPVWWPVPKLDALRQYDALVDSWNTALRTVGPMEAGQADLMGLVWIVCCTGLVVTGDLKNFGAGDLQKDALVKAAKGNLAEINVGQARGRSWLAHVLAMLAPEGGMASGVVEEITKATKLNSLLRRVGKARDFTEEVRRIRAKSLDRFKKVEASDAWSDAGALPGGLSQAIPTLARSARASALADAAKAKSAGEVAAQAKSAAEALAKAYTDRGNVNAAIQSLLPLPETRGLTNLANWDLVAQAHHHPINALGDGCLRPMI